MKRFLIFVAICVVSLGIGFTVFRFMTLDEIIQVQQTVYEVNMGDDLPIVIHTENLKSEITVTSADESIIAPSFSDVNQDRTGADKTYNFSTAKGGQTFLTISSSNDEFKPIQIQVTVGDGSEGTPYFITGVDTLKNLGTDSGKPITAGYCYKLTVDLNLTGVEWTPIASGVDAGFNGKFDFNGHTISNLSLTTAMTNAGLFAKIGADGVVQNVNLTNFVFNGNFTNAGALAGVNAGRVEFVNVKNSTIKSLSGSANVGGLVGINNYQIGLSSVEDSDITASGTDSVAGGLVGCMKLDNSNTANVFIVQSHAVASVSATKAVGGLVGEADGSTIENCFAGKIDSGKVITASVSTAYIGGVVGILSYQQVGDATANSAQILNCYSASSFGTVTDRLGGVIGKNVVVSSDTTNVIKGNYYSSEISGSNVSKGISGQEDAVFSETQDTVYGVFKKSKADMIRFSTYHSYYDSDTNTLVDWNDTIWTSDATTLPVLNIETSIVSPTPKSKITEKNTVNSTEKLASMAGSTEVWYLKSDLTVVIDKYTSPINFNGTFIGEKNTDGTPKWTITYTVSSDSNKNGNNAGLFATLGKNAVIKDIAVNVKISGVSAKVVGTLAAVNYGNISNCVATGEISSIVSGDYVSIGGLVGENYGTISNVKSSTKVTYDSSSTNYYIGGVVGYNYSSASLSYSKYLDGGVISTSNINTGYVGGIVGKSESKLTKLVNLGSVESTSSNDGAYVGGICGWLKDANLTTSTNKGAVTAHNAGGVVGYTTGSILECASYAQLRGDNVGGIVCLQGYSKISNCLSQNNLVGFGTSSNLCGIAYQVNIIDYVQTTLDHVFCANTFGQGNKYYETTSDVRGGKDIFHGDYPLVISSCVYVKDTVGSSGAIRSVMPLDWLYWAVGNDPKLYDCGITDESAKSGKCEALTNNGFDSSIWQYTIADSYPTLKNAAV